MDCVNHSGVNATAYCQNCGKALCSACVRGASGGQIFCEPCWMGWQASQVPFVVPPAGAPSPGLAAFLGLIPGVGAMYNGQFIKGLVHVFIFAVLVSAAHVYGIFGLFIAGWVCYQVFEAYHTAKARRDGEPLPDPLGLNEIGNWFTSGRPQPPPPPGSASRSRGWRAGACGPVPGAGPGAVSTSVPGPIRNALSDPVSGSVHTARLYRSGRCADSARFLASKGTDRRHYSHRAGCAVSVGAVRLVLMADCWVQLAGPAHWFGGMAVCQPHARHSEGP